jgi:hypothetical protein
LCRLSLTQRAVYDGQLVVFNTQRNLDTKLSFQIKRSSSYEHSGDSVRSLPTQCVPQQYAGDVAIPAIGAIISAAPNSVPQQHAGDVTIPAIGAIISAAPNGVPQQHAGDVANSTVGEIISAVPNGVTQLQFGSVQAVVGNTADTFQSLLSRIESFVKIGRIFSEVQTYLGHIEADLLIIHLKGSSVYQDGIHDPDCRL